MTDHKNWKSQKAESNDGEAKKGNDTWCRGTNGSATTKHIPPPDDDTTRPFASLCSRGSSLEVIRGTSFDKFILSDHWHRSMSCYFLRPPRTLPHPLCMPSASAAVGCRLHLPHLISRSVNKFDDNLLILDSRLADCSAAEFLCPWGWLFLARW